MIFSTFVKLLTGDYKIKRNDFIIPLLITLLGYDIVTLIYSNFDDLAYFPSYIIQQLIILFGYVVILNSNDNKNLLLKSYILSVFFPVYLGLYQWISFMLTGVIPPLPFQQFLLSEGLSELFLLGNLRIVGPLQDPSLFGLYLASVAIICIGLILLYPKLSKLLRVFLLCTAILIVTCILTTGSVSSLVNLSAGFLFVLFKSGKNFSTFILKLILSVFIVCFALSILSFYFDYDALFVLIEKFDVIGGGNVTFHRDEYLNQAWQEFFSSPIFGVGFGNLKMVSAHNTYLTFLAQQGVIGFILNCLLLVFYPFIFNKKYLNISLKQSYPYVIICCAALFGALFQFLAYDIMYLIDVTGVIVLLMLASLNNAKNSRYI